MLDRAPRYSLLAAGIHESKLWERLHSAYDRHLNSLKDGLRSAREGNGMEQSPTHEEILQRDRLFRGENGQLDDETYECLALGELD
jgi:hypothetical protein